MVFETEYVPPRLTIPWSTRMVPSPETVELGARVDVAPLNSSVAESATAHDPVLAPPLPKLVVPIWRSTLPVLLNGRLSVVVPLPADLRKVPMLLKAGDPPPLAPICWSVLASNVPLLLNVPPPEKMMLPPPVQVAVPLLSTTRCP